MTTQLQHNYRYYLTTRKYAVLAGGVVLLCIGLVVVGIVPQAQAALTLWSDWQTEKKMVAQLEKKANELSTVQSSLAFAKAETVNQVLPAKKPLLELLSAVNLAATTTQVQVADISLSPGNIATDAASLAAAPASTGKTTRKGSGAAAVKKAYEALEVSLKVTGPLTSINQFFIQVEKTAPASILTSISLSKMQRQALQAADAPEQFEAKITITTYYYTQSVTAALEAPLPPITAVEEKVLAELDTFTYPTVQSQLQIQGGGLVDLFGALNQLPTLPDSANRLPTLPSPTPQPSPSPTSQVELAPATTTGVEPGSAVTEPAI